MDLKGFNPLRPITTYMYHGKNIYIYHYAQKPLLYWAERDNQPKVVKSPSKD